MDGVTLVEGVEHVESLLHSGAMLLVSNGQKGNHFEGKCELKGASRKGQTQRFPEPWACEAELKLLKDP